jgi:diguanylate cyclase (GGDEF)-like protein
MTRRPVHVLLIEDDSKAARRIERALAKQGEGAFALERVDRLVPGLDRLACGGVDICLLDLSLPDSRGSRAILAARAQAPDVPILALVPSNDDELAHQAVADGAQGSLATDRLEARVLAESIRRASEQQPAPAVPPPEQVVDGLTSMLNERGLLEIGNRYAEVAVLTRRPFALLYLDVNGLAAVNATHGPQAGDRFLLDITALLVSTFRSSDIIARVGGDEFCVLLSVVLPDGSGERRAVERLDEAVEHFNMERPQPTLSLTSGTARFDPGRPAPFETLLLRAKHEMRERKARTA